MDIDQYMTDLGRRARHASRAMARASTAAKNAALEAVARAMWRGRARRGSTPPLSTA
jgi:glutamate-5-semialdehyde dehydrogenase